MPSLRFVLCFTSKYLLQEKKYASDSAVFSFFLFLIKSNSINQINVSLSFLNGIGMILMQTLTSAVDFIDYVETIIHKLIST